jgi:hypothetical protein
VKRHTRRIRDPHPEFTALGLPVAAGGPPVGVPASGLAKPSKHESAVLRRLAQHGSYLLVTLREDKGPLYTYDSGETIRGSSGNPLTQSEFRRLGAWLVPVGGESLLDIGPPQRWRGRRLEDRR